MVTVKRSAVAHLKGWACEMGVDGWMSRQSTDDF